MEETTGRQTSRKEKNKLKNVTIEKKHTIAEKPEKQSKHKKWKNLNFNRKEQIFNVNGRTRFNRKEQIINVNGRIKIQQIRTNN